MWGIWGPRGWVASINPVSGAAEWTRDARHAWGTADRAHAAELADGIGEAKSLGSWETARRTAPVRN